MQIAGEGTGTEVKVLGMIWNREKDTLRAPEFKLNENASTARQVISTMKGAYDLFNINLPVLNRGKLFLQDLQCNKELRWDDKLTTAKLGEWKLISKQFNEYESLEVPRFIGRREGEYSLILFSDASKHFLSMVMYMKDETGRVSYINAHNRILDKTLKGRTMPVLEFLALEFAVEKGLDVYKTFTSCPVPLKIEEVLLFTDSTIALNWLVKAEYAKSKMQTRSAYVNNHIEKVVANCREVHPVKFCHVGSQENSADIVSRLVSPRKLKSTCLVTGPSFLQSMEDFEWVTVPNHDADNSLELPKFAMNKVEIEVNSSNAVSNIINLDKFSSLHKAVKVLQLVKKYINKLTLKVNQNKGSNRVCMDESYVGCETEILRCDQRNTFPEIFRYFESSNKAKKDIPDLVNKLNIFLDPEIKVLKVKSKMGKMVKGRISNTPILLSKSSRFSFLLISDYHRKFNHSGIYYVLHKLKPKYFLLKAYSAVKRVLNECYHCRRFNARPIKVNANDYKEWNINPEKRFFSHCFVDYFGPYFTRYGSEKVKTYGVIFKCVWSKMINVEIVTCADASNFLIAFQNHVYAYGLPTKLFSDSGSNLAKAFAWIRESLDSVEVKAYLDQTGVKVCTFEQYPRGSLNRGIGGIIESGVALVRKLIQGSIRNNILDFQQFSHVIKQCICYANKKPLSIESLRGENPDDQFQIFSPEFLKFGYETAVLEVNGGNESDDWMFEDLEVKEEMKKMLEVKERLRNSYHSEFLYGLLNQATKEKDKYVPVLHIFLL